MSGTEIRFVVEVALCLAVIIGVNVFMLCRVEKELKAIKESLRLKMSQKNSDKNRYA